MRIGTMLSMPGDNTTSRGLVERAVAAEEAGFASAWLPQVTTVDALTVLALAGPETVRIELGRLSSPRTRATQRRLPRRRSPSRTSRAAGWRSASASATSS